MVVNHSGSGEESRSIAGYDASRAGNPCSALPGLLWVQDVAPAGLGNLYRVFHMMNGNTYYGYEDSIGTAFRPS